MMHGTMNVKKELKELCRSVYVPNASEVRLNGLSAG